jgi:hypothetical protein
VQRKFCRAKMAYRENLPEEKAEFFLTVKYYARRPALALTEN